MSHLSEFASTVASQEWPGEAVTKPNAWKNGEIARLVQLHGDPNDPANYRLRFKRPADTRLAAALGWRRDLVSTNYEPPSLIHVAMVLSQAHEVVAQDLMKRLAAYSPITERIATPCLHYVASHGLYVVAAGPQHHRWLRATGFSESTNTKLWITPVAMKAAPLIQIATPVALAALRRDLPGFRLLKDYAKVPPIPRPWMGYDPTNRTFTIHGHARALNRLVEIAPAGFSPGPDQGTLVLRNPELAADLAVMAEPRLSDQLTRQRFIDLDPIALLDLLGTIVQDSGAGGGPKKAKDGEKELKALRYSKTTGRFQTSRPEASRDPRWQAVKAQPGSYTTFDGQAALALRSHADDAAEIAIEKAMVTALNDNAKALPFVAPPTRDPNLVYKPAQVDGIAFTATRRFSINADPMGFGKTMQAIGSSDAIGAKNTLVVTLASVGPAFEAAFSTWSSADRPVNTFNGRNSQIVSEGATIASYEAITHYPEAFKRPWDFVIIDELHKAKNDAAQRTRALRDVIAPNAGAIMALSGTPVPRRPQDLYTVLHMGAPEIFQSKRQFMDLYGIADLSADDRERQLRRQALGDILYSGLMIRRPKALLGLPPKTRETVVLNVTDPALAEQLEREGLALRAMQRAESVTERSRIMMRLGEMRRDSAMYKIPSAIAWAQEMKRKGQRFVIFAHHKVVLNEMHRLAKTVGLDSILVHGGTGTPRQRQAMITDFQSGAGDGIIAGIAAAGTGTTMTAASAALIVELDWNPFEMLQAEDRLHRIGQLLEVDIDYMVFQNSVDARIATIADHKLRMADDILGYDGETVDEVLVKPLDLAA